MLKNKKGFTLAIFVISAIICNMVYAQSTNVIEDFKPSEVNQPGKAFPQVNSEGRVRTQISAPGATLVQIDIGGVKYNLEKDANGVWTGESAPQDEGFHYYQLNIDGASVPDPGTRYFYGAGRWGSGIEIPARDGEFYALKDVPHGAISSRYYFSDVTKSWRRLFVYTPPDYDKNFETRYPVVYIQHGGGEDETGWGNQGKIDLILDNLIAEGKAKQMIVVMANGNIRSGVGGYSSEGMASFKNEMTQNIVPFIDQNYRTQADAKNRAICGLSMGGGQSFYAGLESLDFFASVGTFSSGIFGGIRNPSGVVFDAEKEIPGLLSQSAEFNNKLDLFYISCGEADMRIEHTKRAVATMKESGLDVVFNSFPGGHDWQVWRKSFYDFASRVFQ